MSPSHPLAVVSNNAPTPKNRTAPFISTVRPATNDEHTMRAMLGITLLHVAALLWLIYHPAPSSEQPVLAFSVTLMDLSSSNNSVSSAASAASIQATKAEPQKSTETPTPDARSAKLKKTAKPTPVTAAKNSSNLSHNSQAQTAVLAPTTPAQFDAAYLQNPKPTYPALSRRMHEEGNVMLSVYVSQAGQAEIVKLQKSSGFSRLDDAAVSSVQRWRFAAAKQGEQLIASWVQVPIKFVLE